MNVKKTIRKRASYFVVYRARPEVKAREIIRDARPERKIKKIAWNATRNARPEIKARKTAYETGQEVSAQRAAYRAIHKTENSRCKTVYKLALRLEGLNAYGGPKCTCCGETLIEGLTLDHIGGDGANHRKTIHGSNVYHWLKKMNYPPGYQVLCMTCNWAKGTDDHCPHEDLRIAWG